jgi:hypothetical protein
MTNKLLKTIQEALATINRLFTLLEAKDAEIARLQERVAMLEFASNARKQLERAKPVNNWVN